MRKGWDQIWGEYENLNWFGRRLKKSQSDVLKRILADINLSKSSRILDIGCGTGSTLQILRSLGFKKSVGVDFSEDSITLCWKMFGFKKGKDVHVMDARKLKFKNGSFDLVFSDGMLEHLPSIGKAVSEMCRISKKYILIFQPNQSSIFGMLKGAASKVKDVTWEKEYPYSKDDYASEFSKHRFILSDSGSLNLREMMWLLFVKS